MAGGSNNRDFLLAEVRGLRDLFIEFDEVKAKTAQ
jgi:hypothetical protein